MQLEELSLRLYAAGATHAASRGLILADTKFEFGIMQGQVILIDELLTPDSSRYWPADAYHPGAPQPSFDKQFLRDFLLASGWNREPPPPRLPQEVIVGTASRYAEALRRLTEEIDSLWRTGQLRTSQVTPLDEVRSMMAVFDETLFRVVPEIYRALDWALGPADKRSSTAGDNKYSIKWRAS